MGQFSWFTQDTNNQIGCDTNNKICVYMFDNNGNSWKEVNYQGYGGFGGKDYYELLAEMNGYESDRQIGIDIAYDELPLFGNSNIKYPALYEDETLFKIKIHNFEIEAKTDPNQGWEIH